ncbi:hypothetical protein BGW36DRAFT_389408 [Talaromyces proteolyticus]|uniref:BTB domain-containing protein n=1 Tax=Talaromyces proteolyticus TaxID=1131652 RepID=A0AAD4KFM8_9EURO|nr:uncharacterized protein BGW36DRAFT_389408 [Talaromyces proteolyticus]KAH8690837.1 hypothetical protein BGW36DRAFT_389408 [Talaromyces proteolyticus]
MPLLPDESIKTIARRRIRFPGEDSDVFTELIHWIYRREFSSMSSFQETLFLFKLWIPAGRFEMLDMQNSMMSAILETILANPETSLLITAIDHVYSHTLRG